MHEPVINKILKKDPITGPLFLGVFARDELPKPKKYPACFVFNSKPREHEGEHWLAMFIDSDGTIDFFDSYAYSPNFYKLQPYLDTFTKWTRNEKRIQGLSEFCGLYCIYFLLFKARNKQKHFFSKFSNDLFNNDKILLNYLKKLNKN